MTKWRKLVTRDNSVFCTALYRGMVNDLLDVGFSYAIKNHKILRDQVYVDDQEFSALGKKIDQLFAQDHRLFLKLAEICYREAEAIINRCQELQEIDFSKITDVQLLQLFTEYFNLFYRFSAYLLIPLAAEQTLTTAAQKIVSSRDNSEHLFSILIDTPRRTFSKEEQIELLQIAVKMQTEEKDFDFSILTLLEKHTEKWAWLGDHFFRGTFWTKDDFIRRLKELLKSDCNQKLQELLQLEEESQIKYEGNILVGGSIFFKDMIATAISTGVNGIITGGIDARDFRGMAGGRLVFPRKLDNDIGISVVVCEGFGGIPIGDDIFRVLQEYEGRFVFIDGNKALINLPSPLSSSLIKVKNTRLPQLQNGNLVPEEADSAKGMTELSIGCKVRIVGNSYLGEQGTLLAIDSSLSLLPSGVKSYLATVETARRKIQVPVANLEAVM